jgi:hypothetical protein
MIRMRIPKIDTRIMRMRMQIPKIDTRIMRMRMQILLITASVSAFSPLLETSQFCVPKIISTTTQLETMDSVFQHIKSIWVDV